MAPLRLILIGLALLLGAWLVVLLMVIRVIPPSLALSLGAYGASLAGLVVGVFGVFQYVRGRSRNHDSHL